MKEIMLASQIILAITALYLGGVWIASMIRFTKVVCQDQNALLDICETSAWPQKTNKFLWLGSVFIGICLAAVIFWAGNSLMNAIVALLIMCAAKFVLVMLAKLIVATFYYAVRGVRQISRFLKKKTCLP